LEGSNPSANFEAFVDSVTELGIPESRRIESEEVTAQFIDLNAGLTNAKRAEKEYQKYLEDRTKNVDEIARIYDMLRQVRKEIEEYEGKLRHLNDRVALTTVTIIAREDKEYTPPQAPSFATTIKDTFSGSLGSLKDFGKGCVLFLVAIAPWLPLALVIAIPSWHFFIRRRKSRRASRASYLRMTQARRQPCKIVANSHWPSKSQTPIVDTDDAIVEIHVCPVSCNESRCQSLKSSCF